MFLIYIIFSLKYYAVLTAHYFLPFFTMFMTILILQVLLSNWSLCIIMWILLGWKLTATIKFILSIIITAWLIIMIFVIIRQIKSIRTDWFTPQFLIIPLKLIIIKKCRIRGLTDNVICKYRDMLINRIRVILPLFNKELLCIIVRQLLNWRIYIAQVSQFIWWQIYICLWTASSIAFKYVYLLFLL